MVTADEIDTSSAAAGGGDPLVAAKLAQASRLLGDAGVDAWLIISPEGSDPALPLVVGGAPVSRRGFFLITAGDLHYASVGTHDISELQRHGGYAEIIPYVKDQRAAFLELCCRASLADFSKIAVNLDTHDPAWGGISHGRFRWFRSVLDEVGFGGEIISARDVLLPLRAVKLEEEMRRLRHAAAMTDQVFDDVYNSLALGISEIEVQQRFFAAMEVHGVEPTAEGPIVGFGGPGYTTHREPSMRQAKPGDQLMIDFGVGYAGFTSDISRTIYFLNEEETAPPARLTRLFAAHRHALEAGLAQMRPGVHGWQVDAAARQVVIDAGYPEFEHALGHQVGRMPHDGGTLLAPRWERYGPMPDGVLLEGEIYTLEPTIITEQGDVCQVEEEILITAEDPVVLTKRQTQLLCI